MANEKVNKVTLGNETLIDLTGDTVSANSLLAGEVAHDSRGEQIVGVVSVPDDLNDLSDVNITSPANDQVLKYDSTTSKWVNGTGGGGGSSTLAGLTDVDLTTPVDGDNLKYNGTEWENAPTVIVTTTDPLEGSPLATGTLLVVLYDDDDDGE